MDGLLEWRRLFEVAACVEDLRVCVCRGFVCFVLFPDLVFNPFRMRIRVHLRRTLFVDITLFTAAARENTKVSLSDIYEAKRRKGKDMKKHAKCSARGQRHTTPHVGRTLMPLPLQIAE